MSFDWTMLLFPLFIIALAVGRKGVVSTFARARAFSPETARRPKSLKLENEDLVRDAVKRGKLIALGDGRYYLNAEKFRRRQRLFRLALMAIVVAGVAELVFLLSIRGG